MKLSMIRSLPFKLHPQIYQHIHVSSFSTQSIDPNKKITKTMIHRNGRKFSKSAIYFTSFNGNYWNSPFVARVQSNSFHNQNQNQNRHKSHSCSKSISSWNDNDVVAYNDIQIQTLLRDNVNIEDIDIRNIHDDKRKICVLLPMSNTNKKDTNKLLEQKDSCDLIQIAKEIASKYNFPIFCYNDEKRIYQLLSNENISNIESQDSDHDSISISILSFSHCLHILPYTLLHPISTGTYAIAIQPILDTSSTTDTSTKTRKKRTKKQRLALGDTNMQPFYIDFCASSQTKLGKRLEFVQTGGGGSELLLKAIKVKNNIDNGAIIYDLTAGFGQDSAVMALGSNANQVIMIERDPIIALLLQDALRRLKLFSLSYDTQKKDLHLLDKQEINSIQRALQLSSKLKLIVGDATQIMKSIYISNRDISNNATNSSLVNVDYHHTIHPKNLPYPIPDVCYLDPMFPVRTKSAAVNKNIQILHGLLHTHKKSNTNTSKDVDGYNLDDDTTKIDGDFERALSEYSLLQSAMDVARIRVVVKRPIHSSNLGGDYFTNEVTTDTDDKHCVNSKSKLFKPSFDIRGSINRWDVYLNNNIK